MHFSEQVEDIALAAVSDDTVGLLDHFFGDFDVISHILSDHSFEFCLFVLEFLFDLGQMCLTFFKHLGKVNSTVDVAILQPGERFVRWLKADQSQPVWLIISGGKFDSERAKLFPV